MKLNMMCTEAGKIGTCKESEMINRVLVGPVFLSEFQKVFDWISKASFP